MAVWKSLRKRWLKKLSKDQKGQFKSLIEDIHDEILKHYVDTGMDCSIYLDIIGTNKEMRVSISVERRP